MPTGGGAAPTPAPPTPAPPAPGSISTQTSGVYNVPQDSPEAMEQQEEQDSNVSQTGNDISEVTDPNGGGIMTSAPTATPSSTPSAM